MFGIGAGEFIVILIVGLIVFGPSKLPEVGRAIGKGLREFRKAQAALSQTLNEPLDEKKSAPPATKPAEEKKSVTADDVINLAKERPIVKESSNEKISNGNSGNVPAGTTGASVAGAPSSSDGTDKQS
ncbi:MAG: twin-arginine translocase TatA/TatE family subunit [Quinella sp. 3Q1]|nr:twin-arginine translocase TatA/TatE family subunit [Quinella sp. 3Q1]MBR6889183.1 twin-arginine translocase TatA/TatE family subunit [Selenomonadaceae bacterium]